MVKDTAKILEELQACESFKKFYNENNDYMVDATLSQMLNNLLKTKGLKKSEVIRKSEISEVYCYKIFSGERKPERNKLLCLILAMGLGIDEAQTLLKAAGYSPLYAKIPFDSALLYALCKGYSVIETNEMLYDYDLEMLG
ncbi:MAG: helix-turn-helix transcriptional regulator [Clostridia bacterium]|nr:helix-turn-helix transcriptional regulator [Clostridia bacterium]